MSTKKLMKDIVLLAFGNGLGNATAVISITISTLSARSLGWEGGWTTIPYGLQFLAMLVITLPIARLMVLFDRKLVFLVSALVGTLGGIFGALAIYSSNPYLLCLAHILMGVNFAAVNYYRFAAFDLAKGDMRSIAMSLVVFGGTFAAFIGPMIARNADAFLPGSIYQAAYSGIALVCFTIFIVLLFANVTKAVEIQHKSPKTYIIQGFQNPKLWGGLIATAFGYGIMNILMVCASIEMDHLHFPFHDISYAIQLHVLAMFVPALFMGKLINIFGGDKICIGGIIIMMAGTIAALLAPEALLNYQISLILVGIGWNMLFVAGSYITVKQAPPEVEIKFQSYNNLVIGLVSTISSFSSGILLNRFGWVGLNEIVLAICIILFIIFMYLFWFAKPKNNLAANVNI